MVYALALAEINGNGYVRSQADDHFEVSGPFAFGVVVYGWTDVQVRHWPSTTHLVTLPLAWKQGTEL